MVFLSNLYLMSFEIPMPKEAFITLDYVTRLVFHALLESFWRIVPFESE